MEVYCSVYRFCFWFNSYLRLVSCTDAGNAGVGSIDVVPSDWDFAFLFRSDLLECIWREIDRVRVIAGRASIPTRTY